MVNKCIKRIVLICSFALILNHTVTFADSNSAKEGVVFLLDTSGSMGTNDPQKLALDSVMQLIYSLPTKYEVGVVTYSSDVVLEKGLVSNSNRSNLSDEIKIINYNGYSNATAGLESALTMLDDVEKAHIVLLSDGEILLNSDSATVEARTGFSTQIDRAIENDVQIHVIALADETLIDSEIAMASEKTGGSFHFALGANDIQSAVNRILVEELLVKKTSLGVTNTKEGVADVMLTLLNGSEITRILVSSKTDITDIVADFEAESAMQDLGKRYAFVELNQPISENANLHIETLEKGEVSVDIISEFDIQVNANVSYTDFVPDNKEATHLERVAKIELSFVNHKGKSILIR